MSMQDRKPLDDVNDKIIQQVTDNMEFYGFPGTIGHIMAVVFYNSEKMSLDEITERTGMSKTRMSQVLRKMVQLNIARRVYVKGSRKDYYTIESDYYNTFSALYTSNWRELVIRNQKIHEELINELEAIIDDEKTTVEERDEAHAYLDDTYDAIAYFEWMDNLIDFFDSGEIFKHVPKPSPKKITK